MAIAVIATILAAFLWAVTNHIDKFMINGIDKSGSSIKTLMVFSTLVAGLVISPIWLVVSEFAISIDWLALAIILSASMVYVLALYFYFLALEKNDTSTVVVMFQTIPVFSYILGLVFLNEVLTASQIVGSVIILASSVIISLDFEEKNNTGKFKALLLMLLSSLCYAVYFILFDVAVSHSSYNACAFWYQIGLLLAGVGLMCVKGYRTTFVRAVKNNGKKYFSLNVLNEAINLGANFLLNFAILTIPVAIANVLNGVQGAFVFILGAIGTKLLPKYFKENLSRKVVLQKVGCVALSIVGLVILFA